jgi:hypothetical protein
LESGWEFVNAVEGDERVLSIRQRRALDDEFEHLIYEIAEGLLATLDQLEFAISERHAPSWDARQQERSAFPIREKEPSDRNSRRQFKEQVESWPEEAVRELELVQPYRYHSEPSQSPLWLLRNLANRGKHRIISVVQSGKGLNNFSSGNGAIHSLKLSAVDVMTQEYMRSSLANKVEVSVRIIVQIRFGDGPLLAKSNVMTSLNELHDYVQSTVLAKLVPFA